MFEAKTTKIVRMTRKKNISSLLAILFCTIVIVSTIGNSIGIRNSFAQQELQTVQTQQPSTISQSPWNNNLPTFDNGNIHHNAVISSSQTFTNSKNLDLNHAFVSNKVVGPDRFRFVTSYWTTSDVSRLIDSGRSAGNVSSNFQFPTVVGPLVTQEGTTSFLPAPPYTGVGGTFFPIPSSNLQLEADAGDGYSTLAVVLQYEGVVDSAGITAALKLPSGFKAEFPLTSDRNNHDIALSNYDGPISPSQEIVLYFPANILPNAKVGLSVLGPLALHFLRSDKRSILDSLDASQENMFAKALSVTNTTFPNSTMLNDSFDFKRDYSNTFGRFIPYDFINQVIPILFKVTGREVLDVFQVPYNGGIPVIPGNGTVVPIKITLTNHGDAPLNGLVAQFITATPSFVGAAATSTTFPLAIEGASTYYLGTLAPAGLPGSSRTITLPVMSAVQCNSNYGMQVNSGYINVVGVRQQQTNFVVLTTSGYCAQQALGVEPGSGATTPLPAAPTIPPKALPPSLTPTLRPPTLPQTQPLARPAIGQ
jgi:hypothetical protein